MKNIRLNTFLPNRISIVYDVPYLKTSKPELLGVKINNEYLFKTDYDNPTGYEKEYTYYISNISNIVYDIENHSPNKKIKYFVVNENNNINRTMEIVTNIKNIDIKVLTLDKTRTLKSFSFDDTTKDIRIHYMDEKIPGIPYLSYLIFVILLINLLLFIKLA